MQGSQAACKNLILLHFNGFEKEILPKRDAFTTYINESLILNQISRRGNLYSAYKDDNSNQGDVDSASMEAKEIE
jgi:hypothetical protein